MLLKQGDSGSDELTEKDQLCAQLTTALLRFKYQNVITTNSNVL